MYYFNSTTLDNLGLLGSSISIQYPSGTTLADIQAMIVPGGHPVFAKSLYMNPPNPANSMPAKYFRIPTVYKGPHSMSIWVKATVGGSDTYTVLALSSTVNNVNTRSIQYDLLGNTLRFWHSLGSWGLWINSCTYTANTWFQTGFVLDSQMRTTQYKDGVQCGGPYQGTEMFPTSESWWIGASAELQRGFAGYINNFRTWNRALSANEMMAVYKQGKGDLPLSASLASSSSSSSSSCNSRGIACLDK